MGRSFVQNICLLLLLKKNLNYLVRSLAVEWASEGVRVNALCPGMIYSKSASDNYGEFKMFEKRRPQIPLKRFGTVDEVGQEVVVLV